jgi:hypothetical protein
LNYERDGDSEKTEGTEKPEKQSKTDIPELENIFKFKNKKAKKISMPEIKIELFSTYSGTQEKPKVFPSLSA